MSKTFIRNLFIVILLLFAVIPAYAKNFNNQKTQFLRNNAYRIGTYVFVDGNCIYCRMQSVIMNNLLHDYGIHTLLVSENYCPSLFKLPCVINLSLFHQFHIIYHPVIIMIYKRNNGKPVFHQVGLGVTKLGKLTNRIYYYAKQYQQHQ